MTILIPESYVEIDHPVLKEIFKPGDSIELVPIQKSLNGNAFNAEAITIHTRCYYV